MQSLEYGEACAECRSLLVDVGDELVCQGCGIVTEKEVLELGAAPRGVRGPPTSQQLGSYMGSAEMTRKERRSKGLSEGNSTYAYLKLVSDFAGREDGSANACERMIERVSEKLCFPRVVTTEAASIAKKVLGMERHGKRITIAAVSAYSLIAACKLEGVVSASVAEIIEAYAAMGRRVSSSSIIQLSLESPVKTRARRAEEYLSRVMAKLSMDARLMQQVEGEGIPQQAYFNSLRQEAAEVLAGAEGDRKVGHRPCALAATAVYAAEVVLAEREGRKRRLTQKLLAECGDTAEYTVREQYREIFSQVVQTRSARRQCPPLPYAR